MEEYLFLVQSNAMDIEAVKETLTTWTQIV